MEITYTHDPIEGEPGPNLHWQGSPSEFLRLLNDLHDLGAYSSVTVDLRDLTYIHFDGIDSCKLVSLDAGDKLCQIRGRDALIELDPKIWREFLHKILAISFIHGHVFQDKEDLALSPLIEDANVIMSSVTY